MLQDAYSSTAAKCDYAELQEYIDGIKVDTHAMIDLLKDETTTFEQLDEIWRNYIVSRSPYDRALRAYILNKPKDCYANPRKARQIPIYLADSVNSILTKCIRYTDKSEDRCGPVKS